MSDAQSTLKVQPLAAPSDKEIAAWRALPEEERVNRLRALMQSDDCQIVASVSMNDLLQRAREAARG